MVDGPRQAWEANGGLVYIAYAAVAQEVGQGQGSVGCGGADGTWAYALRELLSNGAEVKGCDLKRA